MAAAEIAKAKTAPRRARARPLSTLAATTRCRRGSWVKVTSTDRCPHSLVRVMIDTSGSSRARTSAVIPR